jgi:exopolyphosphatase / guanosine-5'-triphosphate,3'-diphosphate pyrophosphatase
VRSACVDIGSNTTRLLVAEIDGDGVWRELMTQRAYTLIGKRTGPDGRLPEQVIANTAEVVSTQVRLAREMGADDISIVVTAAVRGAPNKDELLERVLDRTGLPIRSCRAARRLSSPSSAPPSGSAPRRRGRSS